MAKEIWLWLAAGLGYGAVNSGELLAAFPGGAEEIAADLNDPRLDEILTQKQAQRLAATKAEVFAKQLARAEANGVTALPFDDAGYPEMLRSIYNPPPVVFVKGDLSLLNGQLSIGMVGARRPSAYGVEAVQAIGRGVALGGAIIVSGLASGLDAEAHKAALAVNGPTIACIAFGHDTCYPAANKKLMEIIARYGAVISEYPVGTRAEKPYFLQRNRLIAGLSHGLVVAEARKQSGTMSTVNFATDYGRDVFAVPGSIFSPLSGGTNAMIREGAHVAASATDILQVYGIELQEEDPVVAAAKQAEEARPKPASREPAPWQQNLARQLVQNKENKEAKTSNREQPWQQTLAEALQGELQKDKMAGGQERVTSRQAIDAFRRLQQALPPGDDTEVEARNRALDEMVEAVSDSVVISTPPKAKRKSRKAKAADPSDVKPFPWDKVEHLSKEEMEKARGPAKPMPQLATNSRQNTQPYPPAYPQQAARPARRVEPVQRVQAVEGVAATEQVAQTSIYSEPQSPQAEHTQAAQPMPLQTVTTNTEREPEETRDPVVAAVQQAPPEELMKAHHLPEPQPETGEQPAVPDAEEQEAPQQEQASPFASLKEFLRTYNGTAEQEGSQTEPLLDMEGEEQTTDPLGALSDSARRAYAQLGAEPVSLAHITEASGLSTGEAMAALTELELAGLSRQLAGRQFVIMQ